MNIPVSLETVSNLIDITSCLLFSLLVVFLTSGKRLNEVDRRLLVGALLMLAALTCNVTARTFAYTDAGSVIKLAENAIRLISFGLLFSSIAVVFRCYALLGPAKERKRRAENMYCLISIGIGTLVFIISGKVIFFSIVVLAELLIGLVYGLREGEAGYSKAAFAFSVLCFGILLIIYMIWPAIRLIAIGMVVLYVVLYAEYIKYTEKMAEEKERELERIRLNLLMGQIYPHFIFNTLQTIKGLCETDPDKAGGAIDTFADYLRANLESLTAETMIPFADELEHVKAFLELEELQDRKQFRAEYSLEITDFMIPPLVLQPLVENAVRHGAVSEGGEIPIRIETYRENDRIYIKVTNNRIKDDVQYKRKRRSVGVENVRKRLEIQCGGKLELALSEDAAEAVIEIPYIPVKQNK